LARGPPLSLLGMSYFALCKMFAEESYHTYQSITGLTWYLRVIAPKALQKLVKTISRVQVLVTIAPEHVFSRLSIGFAEGSFGNAVVYCDAGSILMIGCRWAVKHIRAGLVQMSIR